MGIWPVLLILLLSLAPSVGCTPPKHPTEGGDLIGKQAPELHVELLGGEGASSLAEARGKVAIVDFWGTFCDPCRKSFPVYQELVDEHGGNVQMLAVSVDEPDNADAEAIMEFANEFEVSFPILWDKEQKTAKIYDPPKMPTSYIVDREGIIRHVHAGYTADEPEAISEEVSALLEE